MRDFAIETTWDNKFIIVFEGGEELARHKDYCYISSYHCLCARVLGFSYPDYLLYCKANGATLKGKRGYCYPIWNKKEDCLKVLNLINNNWYKLINVIHF